MLSKIKQQNKMGVKNSGNKKPVGRPKKIGVEPVIIKPKISKVYQCLHCSRMQIGIEKPTACICKNPLFAINNNYEVE